MSDGIASAEVTQNAEIVHTTSVFMTADSYVCSLSARTVAFPRSLKAVSREETAVSKFERADLAASSGSRPLCLLSLITSRLRIT